MRIHGNHKSQHRKAMLLDWTKMSYKPLVVLYYERGSQKQMLRCHQEMSELRDEEIRKLGKDKMKLQNRINFKNKLNEREIKDHKSVERKFNALQCVVLEVVDDKDLRSINSRFNDNIGNRMGPPLLTRPFQSVLKANETNELCIPSKTQEEPLEVIDLDEVYKMKQIDTNGL